MAYPLFESSKASAKHERLLSTCRVRRDATAFWRYFGHVKELKRLIALEAESTLHVCSAAREGHQINVNATLSTAISRSDTKSRVAHQKRRVDTLLYFVRASRVEPLAVLLSARPLAKVLCPLHASFMSAIGCDGQTSYIMVAFPITLLTGLA